MRTREFPVLSETDQRLIERLAVGLGDDAARVLAYLFLRGGHESYGEEPATLLDIRIGTSLARGAITDALNRLERRDLVAATTVRTGARGRPPRAWRATTGARETVVRRVYEQHAQALLEQARAVATERSTERRDGQAVGPDGDTASNRIRLGLNWRPNGLHAPFFAAVSAGSYEDSDIAVSIDAYEGSGRALEAVTSGATDVALVGAATFLRARETGTPVVPLALLFQRAMAVLYTTRDAFGARLHSAEQLRDRRIGMPIESETGLLGRLFLSQAGILDETVVTDLAGEERAALQSGHVDAVTGSFSDPRELRTEGTTVDSLLVADRFPMYGLGLITTERTLRERESQLERFLVGTILGWTEALRRPATAVEAIGLDDTDEAIGVNDERTTEHERRTFERAVAEFGTSGAVDAHGWGWQRVDGWRRLETALDQAGMMNAQ